MNQSVLAARTKTGKDYEPSSLRGILSSIERHLSRFSYGKTIFKDSDFLKKKTKEALKAVGLNNMIHFGLRGCKEQKELRWVDIVLKTESDGKEYLEYFERRKKTRTGEDPRNQRPIKPRMYANNDAISIERIVIQCTFARCTEKTNTRGGLATAFELAAFRLSMIALVKKSVNHSRTVANMPRTGWEQQQQKVRVRSDSVK